MSNSTGGDVRVFEDDFKEPSTEVWPEKDLLFSFRISSQSANALIILWPAAAARSSLQSTSTNTSMSNSVSPRPSVKFRPSGSSHQAQAQVPQLLQGRFASELQQDGRMSAPGFDLPQLEDAFTFLIANLRA